MSLSNTQKTWRGTANGPSGVVLGSPWIPFALPGQIVLGSEAVTGTSTTTVRPSIALNGWRSYDPLFGAFLQPDTNDQSGTSWPEQYFLALNNPVAFQDRIGNSSQLEDAVRSGLSIALELLDLYDYSRNLIFAGNCAKHELTVRLAVADAVRQIQTCSIGVCGFSGGEGLRRAWINNLMNSRIKCPPRATSDGPLWVNWKGDAIIAPRLLEGKLDFAAAWTFTDLPYSNLAVAPSRLEEPFGPWLCLQQLVAHEALHWTNQHYNAWTLARGPAFMTAGEYFNRMKPPINGKPADDELWVQATTNNGIPGIGPSCVKMQIGMGRKLLTILATLTWARLVVGCDDPKGTNDETNKGSLPEGHLMGEARRSRATELATLARTAASPTPMLDAILKATLIDNCQLFSNEQERNIAMSSMFHQQFIIRSAVWIECLEGVLQDGTHVEFSLSEDRWVVRRQVVR